MTLVRKSFKGESPLRSCSCRKGQKSKTLTSLSREHSYGHVSASIYLRNTTDLTDSARKVKLYLHFTRTEQSPVFSVRSLPCVAAGPLMWNRLFCWMIQVFVLCQSLVEDVRIKQKTAQSVVQCCRGFLTGNIHMWLRLRVGTPTHRPAAGFLLFLPDDI